MNSGIYKILNLITGKFYIGSAVNIAQRWRQHKRYLNLGNHQNIHLQRAWNKYWGLCSFKFEILELCEKERLLIVEQKWLDATQCFNLDIGYNLTPTAGSSLGVKHSEETRKRMSEASQNRSLDHKTKLALAHKGKTHTAEHKAKISSSNKGRIVSEETKAKIGKANTGKIRTEETKLKISLYNTGRKRGKYNKRIVLTTSPLMSY